MTREEFEELSAKRDELRELHQGYCDDVNGPTGEGEGSPSAARRDELWKEIQRIESVLTEDLEQEAAAERLEMTLLRW